MRKSGQCRCSQKRGKFYGGQAEPQTWALEVVTWLCHLPIRQSLAGYFICSDFSFLICPMGINHKASHRVVEREREREGENHAYIQ